MAQPSWSDSDLQEDERIALEEAEEVEGKGKEEESSEEMSLEAAPVHEVIVERISFRLNAKNLYLTYPQCDEDPSVVISQCLGYWGDDLEWVVCGQELHMDGNYHLHIAISLKKRVDYRSPDCLDWIVGKHGDYRVMKNKSKCLKYVTKEGVFEEHGIDVMAYLEAHKTHKSVQSVEVAQGVMNKETLVSLNVRFPGFFLMNLPKIQTYQSWFEVTQSLDSGSLTELPLINPLGLTVDEMKLHIWIGKNLHGRPDRRFGTKQLYLLGSTGLGKTSLLMTLAKHYRIFWMPMEEDFYDTYQDELYDLIVLDDFKAQKKIQFLNRFVQGSPEPLRIKGGQVMKRKNLPVIVTSNYRLEDCYHNTFDRNPGIIDTVKRRFEVVHLVCNIFTLLDRYNEE